MNAARSLMFAAPPLPYCSGCGEDTYAAGTAHPDRYGIREFDLLFVTRGRLLMQEEDARWTVSAGQMLLLCPYRRHFSPQPCAEETHFYWVHFQTMGAWEELAGEPSSARLAQAIAEQQRKAEIGPHRVFSLYVPKHAAIGASSQVFGMFSRLLELERRPAPGSAWELQRLFHELLLALSEEHRQETMTPAMQVAEKTADYLKRHYRDRLTNERLREALHYHPNYITRCMQAIYGCTPMGYLQDYRLEQAKALLRKTELPVTRIAEESGFARSSHFSRLFAGSVGMTPSRYRGSFRQGGRAPNER